MRTKLTRPPVSSRHVHRPHLLERLDRGRHRPLTLVSAPAGYGKSTLVSCWLESCDTPGAWLSLDENDNDLLTFTAYLIAAVQTLFPAACRDTEALLSAPDAPPVPVLATSLLNELDRIEQPFLLVLDDYFSGHENFAILGSDISTQVLEIAELGIYPGSATSGVPDRFKRKYLMRGKGKWAGKVRVVPELRAKVRFRKINLIEKIPIKTRLDIVFCRNVIIYFDKPTQKDLFERIWRLLSPGGYLFIGHSETLSGISNRFEQVSVSVYRRPEEDKGL